MITTIITTGYHLVERAREWAGAVEAIIVSLDYPEAETHRAYRGRPGLFPHAIRGIELLQQRTGRRRAPATACCTRAMKPG